MRAFARELAEIVVSQAPAERTLEQRKSARRGRVFVDTNRNAYAQTVAPVYAVRARRGASVSVPLAWSELVDAAGRTSTGEWQYDLWITFGLTGPFGEDP